MEIKVVTIPEDEGGGFCAHVVGPDENRLRGDGDTEEEALRDLANVIEDYKETHGAIRKCRSLMEKCPDCGADVGEPCWDDPHPSFAVTG